MNVIDNASNVMEPWEPLDGTSEAFNTLAENLGLDMKHWCFVHVLGLDDDTLALTAAGAIALILLYPTTDEAEQHLRRPVPDSLSPPSNMFFVRQLVGGMCGTIAVLHALVNSVPVLGDAVGTDSILKELYHKTELIVPSDSTNTLEDMPRWVLKSKAVRLAHQAAVPKNTKAVLAGQRQGRHFVTFVNMDGRLVELDGRRGAPICRSEACSADTFLKDVASEVCSIVDTINDPVKQLQFSLVALVPNGFHQVDRAEGHALSH